MPDTLVPVKRWARLLPFNPSSHQQVKAYIKAKRYPMPKHRTERDDLGERKDTSNDESLQKLLVGVANGDPVLEGVLTSRHLSKAASYLADTYVHPDGRLHPIFTMRPKQRLSSAAPSVMNFPKGKRGDTMKEAADAVLSSIMADEGFTLVSADWNSLHPTLIAYFADDPSYARVARLGDHSYVLSHYLALVGERAEPVDLNRPDEVVSSELSALKHHPKYAMAKIANLAGKYLQGEKNMALGTGLSIEQVRGLRRAMALAAPKVHAWRWRTLATAHAERRLTSPFGLSLPFFDIFRVKGGKVSVDRRETNEVFPDGVPVLGAEAPEASAFLPLATESGMLREVLVDLGTREGFERDYFLLIPEHDKVILEVEDSLLDTTIRGLIIPCMSREWRELGGLKVGVDVEVGKILSSCPKGCEGEGEERCPLGHMKEWKP
jgi:hypothetical protein